VTLVSIFPDEHPLRESVYENYARFLRRAHKLSEAKRQFNNSMSVIRPKWGSDEFKNHPERRIRGKLRIVEATATVATVLDFEDKLPSLLSGIRDELKNPSMKPWNPKHTIGGGQPLTYDFSVITQEGVTTSSD